MIDRDCERERQPMGLHQNGQPVRRSNRPTTTTTPFPVIIHGHGRVFPFPAMRHHIRQVVQVARVFRHKTQALCILFGRVCMSRALCSRVFLQRKLKGFLFFFLSPACFWPTQLPWKCTAKMGTVPFRRSKLRQWSPLPIHHRGKDDEKKEVSKDRLCDVSFCFTPGLCVLIQNYRRTIDSIFKDREMYTNKE